MIVVANYALFSGNAPAQPFGVWAPCLDPRASSSPLFSGPSMKRVFNLDPRGTLLDHGSVASKEIRVEAGRGAVSVETRATSERRIATICSPQVVLSKGFIDLTTGSVINHEAG